MKSRGTVLLALVAAWLLGHPAAAEEGGPLEGTLKAVRDRGTLLVGYRASSIPFSFLNKAGQPIGFSLELCRGIAADIASALNRDLVEPDAPAWQTGIRIVLVPVAADERLPKILAGQIDLECGSTTANADRRKIVAFSPVFFLAGTKIMIPTDKLVASYQALAGRSIAVSTGTTNADVVKRLGDTLVPPIKVIEASGTDAAYDLLSSGRADAFASDDILLYGFAATRPDGGRMRVVGDYLSFEPYAIAFRRDDPSLAALVKSSFERMARNGQLSRGYRRWFTQKLPTGETLGLPMSPHLAEMYRALGEPD